MNQLRLCLRDKSIGIFKAIIEQRLGRPCNLEKDPLSAHIAGGGLNSVLISITDQEWQSMKTKPSDWLSHVHHQEWFRNGLKHPTDLVVIQGQRDATSVNEFSTLHGALVGSQSQGPSSAIFAIDKSSGAMQIMTPFVDGRPFNESNAAWLLTKTGRADYMPRQGGISPRISQEQAPEPEINAGPGL